MKIFAYLLLAAFIFTTCMGPSPDQGTAFKQQRDTLSTVDEIFGAIEDGVLPLNTVPGNSWTQVTSADTLDVVGFAFMSQDSSNQRELIVTDEAMRAWVSQIAQDSVSASGEGAVITAATFVIGSSTTTDSVHYSCDGTADDVQIQAAFDAAPSEGATLYLREGVYNLASTINVPSTKKIRFTGAKGAVITMSSPDTLIKAHNSTQTGFGQEEDLEIDGFRIDVSNTSGEFVGIHLENKHIANIHDMVFVGDSLKAINLKRTNNIKIYANYFNRVKTGVYGIAGSVVGDDLEDIAIFGNDFSYSGQEAIYFASTSQLWQREIAKVLIYGNNIEEADYDETYKYAIYIGECRGGTIADNSITQTKRGGAIELEDCSLMNVQGNVFRENGEAQSGSDSTSTVLLRNTNSSNIIGNTISSESTDFGITLLSSDSNNVVLNPTQLASADAVREFSSTENVVSLSSGGSFDASANIAFTGNNTHGGGETFNSGFTANALSTFNGVSNFNNDVTVTGEDNFTVTRDAAAGAYFNIYAGTGGAAGIKPYAYGGTFASPTATVANQFIFLVSGRGYGTSFTTGARGWWGIRAGSLWSGSNNETYQQWATTENGTTSASVRMELTDQGALLLESNEGFFGPPSLTTTERNALSERDGAIISNETVDSLQVSYGGTWYNLSMTAASL